MALTKRQMEEYSGMSFEDLCDLIDQYKSDEEDYQNKIENFKNEIEELKSTIYELNK